MNERQALRDELGQSIGEGARLRQEARQLCSELAEAMSDLQHTTELVRMEMEHRQGRGPGQPPGGLTP